MTDLVLTGEPDLVVEVVRPTPPVFEVAPPDVDSILVLPLPGPAGAGLPGPAGRPGQPRFVGSGPPPDALIGAEPGDQYLDQRTGDLYTLT